MGDDNMNSDQCVSLQRRIHETEQNLQQESSVLLPVTTPLEKDLDSVYSLVDELLIIQISPKKKVNCFSLELDTRIEEKQELGSDPEVSLVSSTEKQQESLDSCNGKERKELYCDMSFALESDKIVKGEIFSSLVEAGKKDFARCKGDCSGIQELGKYKEDNFLFDEKENVFSGSVARIRESGKGKEEMVSTLKGKEKVDSKGKKKVLMEKDIELDNLLLTELEAGTIKKQLTGTSQGGENEKAFENRSKKINHLVNGNFAYSKPLKIEVVDDTALIESVPVNKKGNGFPKKQIQSLKRGNGFSKEQATKVKYVKKGKQSRKKGKGKMVMEVCGGGGIKNGIQSKMCYSKKEMESLRFVKINEQRDLWRVVYNGLAPTVVCEYEQLTGSNNHKNIRVNFDPVRRDEAAGILSVGGAVGRRNGMSVFAH